MARHFAHEPPSGGLAYGELREGWFYLGGDILNVTLPTSPVGQLDIYGGVRPTWGPLTFDFGAAITAARAIRICGCWEARSPC